MDTTQWAQGIGLLRKPLEEELHPSSYLLPTTTAAAALDTAARAAPPGIPQQSAERKAPRPPQKEQALHCPRCNSTNTKFCYYNNYSLTQPRYFCKACRRYWTEGGSLRNVPVGGGSRKNKRHSSSNPSSVNVPAVSSSSSIKNLNPPPPSRPPQMPSSSNQHFDQVHDLNLAFPNHNSFLNLDSGNNSMGNGGGGTGGLSAMELLRSSGITARGLGPLVPMQMSMPMPPESMYPYDGGVGMQEGSRRLLFPFGDMMKQEQQHRGQGGEPPMFWNGMMGGGNGSSW